ncbi:cytochrome P450 [Nocardia cyriacigeorgica]|uniref:cytochrome P450 n=1 Tax=Nocardia cyriacigeorgica TaxID=135487 RepID=UPI001E3763CC|nr:cytochrome P450 [Nocardia cyriacigeorgica]
MSATVTNIDDLGPRIPIYSEAFAADPHGHYRHMRERYGSIVPVEIWPEIPATLVIGYNTARNILSDTAHFSSDPRRWQATLTEIQGNAPIMGMLEWRPNALFNDGVEHSRHRGAANYALAGVDLEEVRRAVEVIANRLINRFIGRGHADLLKEYAEPLAFEVLTSIVGCPAHLGEKVAAASAILFEGVDPETAHTVNKSFVDTFTELARLKGSQDADDIASRLLRHKAELNDIEFVSHMLTFFSAGSEIPKNWIANTLYLMMTDARYITTLDSPQLSTSTALEETLHNEPPLANYCAVYPRGPQLIEFLKDGDTKTVWLPANQPVITSMAACTSSPDVNTGDFTEARHNLAFGLGPHTCPEAAQRVARLTAHEAIDQLFDHIPDLAPDFPSGQMLWRPGPFHRALEGLPAKFSPSPPVPYVG